MGVYKSELMEGIGMGSCFFIPIPCSITHGTYNRELSNKAFSPSNLTNYQGLTREEISGN
jgi:hypothetical protein